MKILEDACKQFDANGDSYIDVTHDGNRHYYFMPESVIDQILKWRDEAYKVDSPSSASGHNVSSSATPSPVDINSLLKRVTELELQQAKDNTFINKIADDITAMEMEWKKLEQRDYLPMLRRIVSALFKISTQGNFHKSWTSVGEARSELSKLERGEK